MDANLNSLLVEMTREVLKTKEVEKLYEKWSEKVRSLKEPQGTELMDDSFEIRVGFTWSVNKSDHRVEGKVCLVGKPSREDVWNESDIRTLDASQGVLLEALQKTIGGKLITRVIEEECGCGDRYPVLLLESTEVGDVIFTTSSYNRYYCSEHDDC